MVAPSPRRRSRPAIPVLPPALGALALLGAALLVGPVVALVLQADLLAVPELLGGDRARDALVLSLWTAGVSTLICLLLGVPLGLLLGRGTAPVLRWLRPLVLLPLVLPPVVAGVALLAAFGRAGILGGTLELLGLQITFTSAAVVLAQSFVALPFMVLSVESAVQGVAREYEEAAATMGAGPLATLWWVVLPLIRPALTAGVVLVFARCLGEFGATLAFAGSAPGITRTAPVQIYLLQQSDPRAAAALATVMIAAALVVVAVVHGPARGWFRPRG